MGLFDYIFKSKKDREQKTRVKDALKQADDTIKRIEAGLDKNTCFLQKYRITHCFARRFVLRWIHIFLLTCGITISRGKVRVRCIPQCNFYPT